MAGPMLRMAWLAAVALVVLVALVVTSVVKGRNILEDPDNAERHRGIAMKAAIDAPGRWEAPGGSGITNDEYLPANSGRPPFTLGRA